MKVVVQNISNKAYFKEGTNWTMDPAQAWIFEDTLKALAFCNDHQFSDVQVVMKFDPTRCDVCLPVRDKSIVR